MASAEIIITGASQLKVSDTTYEANATPRFDVLKGSASSKIMPMIIRLSGDLKAIVKVKIPKVIERSFEFTLYKFPDLKFEGGGSNTPLY